MGKGPLAERMNPRSENREVFLRNGSWRGRPDGHVGGRRKPHLSSLSRQDGRRHVGRFTDTKKPDLSRRQLDDELNAAQEEGRGLKDAMSGTQDVARQSGNGKKRTRASGNYRRRALIDANGTSRKSDIRHTPHMVGRRRRKDAARPDSTRKLQGACSSRPAARLPHSSRLRRSAKSSKPCFPKSIAA